VRKDEQIEEPCQRLCGLPCCMGHDPGGGNECSVCLLMKGPRDHYLEGRSICWSVWLFHILMSIRRTWRGSRTGHIWLSWSSSSALYVGNLGFVPVASCHSCQWTIFATKVILVAPWILARHSRYPKCLLRASQALHSLRNNEPWKPSSVLVRFKMRYFVTEEYHA
jgi:hypothetical protein